MLIVKNLKKTYKTKGGVEVHALDDVSITFPENGMVFLLGKSGSGKSTLLNMIGGLDRVDSGEIIVKGKNSKTFSGSDYDSYRNTFIGFIFQEYNILNEFNVEQNISLALQLQGKPNDKKVVEEIMAQVDLQGLGKRKPNTLSGGQKQRVAIARALIKNPEIIMADEPTGALDSNTGKQVFDTLKKLSKDKLVIVVSHDRDFAEYYGDRIIELSDGKIISDTTKEFITPTVINDNVRVINDHTVAIKDTSAISDEDMKQIVKVLKQNGGEAVITAGEHDLNIVKQAIHINSDNSTEVFNDTKEVETKEYDGSETKFTKSRLPFNRAFKMGASSLKLKPFRLIFTSLLTIIALAMFGLTSTLMLFKESYSIYHALKSADYTAEVVSKYYKYTDTYYSIDIETGKKDKGDSWDGEGTAWFDDEEIKSMNNNSNNMTFAGLITFGSEIGSSHLTFDNTEGLNEYYRNNIIGFCEAGSEFINKSGMGIIAGSYPTSAEQVLISKYQFETMKACLSSISDYNSALNKPLKIYIQGNKNSTHKTFTISGIYDAGSIPSEYEQLKTPEDLSSKAHEKLKDNYEAYLASSFQGVVFVHENFYTTYKDNLFVYYPDQSSYFGGLTIRGVALFDGWIDKNYTISEWDSIWNAGTDQILPYCDDVSFYDLNGEPMEYVEPQPGQIYLNENRLNDLKRNQLNSYYEHIDKIIECRDLNQTVYNLINGHEDTYYELANRLRNSVWSGGEDYPEGYDYEEDKQTAKNLIDNYYVDVATKQYIDTMCWRMEDGFYTAVPDEERDSYADFNAFEEKVSQFRDGRPNNFNDLESLKNYLKADSHQWLRHKAADEYSNWWSDRLTDEERQRVDDIHNTDYRLRSNEDFEYLASIVMKYGEKDQIRQLSYDDSWIVIMPELGVPTMNYKTFSGKSGSLEVVGYVTNFECFLNHNYCKQLGTIENTTIGMNERTTSYKESENPKYRFVITHSDYSQSQIDFMIKEYKSYGYSMNNRVYNNLQMMLGLIETLKTVFLIVGLVCGVFAALMLLNFISTSIASKTKEIGILRAVGARGSDLFKIFFSESGLIAAICSVIAIIGSIIACWRLNVMMADEVGIALLDFNIINIGLILAGAVVIAVLGTLVPVIIAAKKPPVESIRSL